MTFDDYQKQAILTDLLAGEDKSVMSAAFLEKAFGLGGEAGEISEKIKKIIRDKGGELSNEDRDALAKELGDVLWYVSALALYLGFSFDEIASRNLEKLASRNNRGKIGGSGDDR